MINIDWDLFGLKEDRSSLKEAKRAYFEICLMTHPDKNHGVSREEFLYVLNEYEKIKKILTSRDKRKTIEDSSGNDIFIEEMKIEDDCVKIVPSFMSIYEEVHEDFKGFNSEFEKKNEENTWFASQRDGYSTITSEYTNMEDMKYKGINDTSYDIMTNNKEYNTNIISIDDVGSGIKETINSVNINENGMMGIVNEYTTETLMDYWVGLKDSNMELDIPKETIDKYMENDTRNIMIDYERIRERYT